MGLLALILHGAPTLAQTPPPVTVIGASYTLPWNPNTETDLAGYQAWVTKGSVAKPAVTLTKTATAHPTSTTCAALGVTTDGPKRFNVLASDQAGNQSPPAFVDTVRDTTAPAQPSSR